MEKTLPLRKRILIVDDDLRLRDLLKRYLIEQGFSADAVGDSSALEKSLQLYRYDLVVLDLMLPGEDGMSICRSIRNGERSAAISREIPIVMLTAKDDTTSLITGFDHGADDFLHKPFNPRELVARINAILRRQKDVSSATAPDDLRVIAFGSFQIDLGARKLLKNGVPLVMTSAAFSLLKVFVTHPRIPLSRDKLSELAFTREQENFNRAIDVQVWRLRKLLASQENAFGYIQAVRGIGYMFAPDE